MKFYNRENELAELQRIQELSFEDVLERIVPKFQRDNDKWSKEMQIKFVENIILGVNTTIILGTLSNEKSECVLIDGLQRVSAIFSFMNKEFKVFEGFEYNEDFENKISTFIHNLKLKLLYRIYLMANILKK